LSNQSRAGAKVSCRGWVNPVAKPEIAVYLGDVAEMQARVTKNGSEVADTTDLEALTGDIVSILGHTAALLGAAGEKLRAGEVVIMGSVITRYRCNRETRSLSSWLHCADLGEGLDPGALDRLPNPRRVQWEAQ